MDLIDLSNRPYIWKHNQSKTLINIEKNGHDSTDYVSPDGDEKLWADGSFLPANLKYEDTVDVTVEELDSQ